MVRAKIKGVNTTHKRLSDGTVRTYYYHRSTSASLPGKPGSPEFIAAYAAAEKMLLKRHSGTFSGLVRDYTDSPFFHDKADATKREYIRMLTNAEAHFGTMPLEALNDFKVKRVFIKWRDEIASASGPREADNRLSVVSAMLSWAANEAVVIEKNHLVGFRRLYHSDRSDMIWLPKHIEAFMSVAPVELQRALMVALHSGQRQGDLLRLSWSNYDGGSLNLRQSKTGRKVTVPCTPALKASLDAIPRNAAVILTTVTGRPWKPRHFKSQWAKAAAAAGVDATGLHFHDLRGTAVTLLAEAGCTVPEIASITGHPMQSAERIIEKYMSRTRGLASRAIMLFQNAPSTKFANRLQTNDQKSNKGIAK
jgi:integrase